MKEEIKALQAEVAELRKQLADMAIALATRQVTYIPYPAAPASAPVYPYSYGPYWVTSTSPNTTVSITPSAGDWFQGGNQVSS